MGSLLMTNPTATAEALTLLEMVDAAKIGDNYEKEKYTKDGTVDIKGRPFLRSRGGRWTACSFIVGCEVFEKVAFFGIAPNLIIYLTSKLHQGTVTSANNITNWMGTVQMTPIIGAYVADAYLGRYWTFIFSSAVYLLGMILLTLAVSLRSLRPPPCSSLNPEDCSKHTTCLQVGFFFLSLNTIALGAGGTRPNNSTLAAGQFDVFDEKEIAQKMSFFNWWTFITFLGNLFSTTVLVYIQDNVSWSVGYLIPTIALAFAILFFVAGTPLYRHKLPPGSPFANIARVLVAATRKCVIPIPKDPQELYEFDSEHYSKQGTHKIDHTSSLRFLDKAAVQSGADGPWMLCPVTQVEETKQMVRLLPMLLLTIIPSAMMAQVLTLFIKQGVTLDRSMGTHFEIPPGSLPSFYNIGTLTSVAIYDRCFIPFMSKYTKNSRGITLLQRIGTGQALYILIMVMAALTERWRLSIVRNHGIVHQNTTVPLSVFVLLPLFFSDGGCGDPVGGWKDGVLLCSGARRDEEFGGFIL